jgi:aspartate aminotransferase
LKPLSFAHANVQSSPIVGLLDRARTLRAEGHDVIVLSGGDPDFPTPRHVIVAAEEALSEGDTHYPPVRGIPSLVDAIVAKHARDNAVTVSPAGVVVTPGAKWAVCLAMMSVCDPEDEVIIIDPSWVSYVPIVRWVGAHPVRVSLSHVEGFRLDEEILRSSVTSHTKMIVVNSPNNPTGRVLSSAELLSICRVAQEFDLYVLADEIYEHITFGSAYHRSIAAISGMSQRTITVNGLSKAYAMTGWRLGWLVAGEEIAATAAAIQSQTLTSAAGFVMRAAVAALRGPQDCVQSMVAQLAKRRRLALDALRRLPGVECTASEGTFYLFPRFTRFVGDTPGLADGLLTKYGVLAAPGTWFGEAGAGHLRINLASGEPELRRGLDMLRAASAWLAG